MLTRLPTCQPEYDTWILQARALEVGTIESQHRRCNPNAFFVSLGGRFEQSTAYLLRRRFLDASSQTEIGNHQDSGVIDEKVRSFHVSM